MGIRSDGLESVGDFMRLGMHGGGLGQRTGVGNQHRGVGAKKQFGVVFTIGRNGVAIGVKKRGALACGAAVRAAMCAEAMLCRALSATSPTLPSSECTKTFMATDVEHTSTQRVISVKWRWFSRACFSGSVGQRVMAGVYL